MKRARITLQSTTLAFALLGAAVGAASADAPGRGTSAETSAAVPGLSGVVNLNTATEAELEQLPGVGPSRAQAIIALRKQKPYAQVEDVMRVKGIGRAMFRKLRAHLTVSGPTTLAAPAKAPSPRAPKQASSKP